MKRTWVLAMLLIAASAVLVNVSAGGRGAVKVPFDPNVGWVLVNTTGNLTLNAVAHLDDGVPNESFDVSVRVRYEDGTFVVYTNIATLLTNDQGQGNVSVHVDLDPPASSGTVRRVAFRLRRPGPPNILYVAIAWDVPLKENSRYSQ